MSNESKPNNDPSSTVAREFVSSELAGARKSAKRAKITTIVLLAVVGGYMGFITVYFTGFLEPKGLAEVVVSEVSQRVEQHATEISDRIKTDVPKLVSDIPDKIIDSLPDLREQLEAKVEEVMIDNLASHSEDFGKHLDDFLALHATEIKELLNATTDKEKMKILMTALEQDILDYLDAEAEDGETLKQKLDVSLEALKNIEKQMDRLANGTDLNEQERKTRRAIALISKKLQSGQRPETAVTN